MIMMRSAPPTKMGKPPPPVPPRPSKTLVQEALAKTRRLSPEMQKVAPIRSAPPPPVNEINKSQSVVSVNVTVNKPALVERSISEEVKSSTRTIIFQSPKVENNKKYVKIKSVDDGSPESKTEPDSKKQVEVKKVDSFLGGSTDSPKITIDLTKQVRKVNSFRGGSDQPKVTVDLPKQGELKKVSSFRSGTEQPKVAGDSTKQVEIKKVSSFRDCKDNKTVERVESFKLNGMKIGDKVSRTDSFKQEEDSKTDTLDRQWDQMLNDRNHVNTLIDEMFASVLEVSSIEEDNKITINTTTEPSPPTVVVIDDKVDSSSSNSSTAEKKKVQFDDRMNHELLISELESMRMEGEKILKRQRLPSKDIYENGDSVDVSKIQHSDWVEVSDGQEVRLSSCQITIDDDLKNEDDNQNPVKLDYERIKAMSSLNGLPPLPKSLSGFNLLDGQAKPPTPMRTTSMRGHAAPSNVSHLVYPPHSKVNGAADAPTPNRKLTNLDTQLAILRREMYSLRQLDLSLLSQLWSLNESIQDFRQILQDQEDRILSPPSPSPAPSSGDEGDGDEFYMSTSSMNFRTPPPPPPVRRPSSSSNASSLG